MKVLKKNGNFYEICLKDDIKINCDMNVTVVIVYSQPCDGCEYLSFAKWSSEYNPDDKVLRVCIEPNFVYAISIEYGKGEFPSYKYQAYKFIKASEGGILNIDMTNDKRELVI